MKNLIYLIVLLIATTAIGQNVKIDPAMIKMGWTFASPIILKKVNDPLTKEIISKCIPKIIDQDVKGTILEATDAIYKVKNVKVLNKEFLSQLENKVNSGIKSIQKQDYVTAVNELITVVAFTDLYLKNGTLNQADSKPQVQISNVKTENIKKEEVESKLHLDKNNIYLFFVPRGKLTAQNVGQNANINVKSEYFKINLDDGKEFMIGIDEETATSFENASIEVFKNNKEASDKLKEVLVKELETNLGSGQVIKSEIEEKYNFKALKYTYSYLDKKTSNASMAYYIVAFHKSTMLLLSFYTSADDFPVTKKSFEEFMENFYIIGVDEISSSQANNNPCETNKTGTLILINNSTNPYDVYIDDKYLMRISGKNKSEKLSINEGNNHKVYAKQVSGYAVYPTEKTKMLNVIRCSDYSWQFPFN